MRRVVARGSNTFDWVAVGTGIYSRAPRTDPYLQLSRIRLLPRVPDGKPLWLRFVVCAPALVTRFPVAAYSPCCAGLHSPRSQPFAPPAPQRIAPPCSPASLLLRGADFPRSCIIGFGSSRRGPQHDCSGRTRDLPSSDAILLRVMCSSTPAGRAVPRVTFLPVLRSTIETVSAPAISPFRGSITHPTQPLCTLRGRRYRRLMQHSLPGRLLGLFLGRTCIDRSRQLVWRLPQLRLDLTSRRQDYSFWRGEIR